jgi:hypothetical protein
MAATPFLVTLALDSNVQPCADLSALLAAAGRADFDVAAASQHRSPARPGLTTHNFALLYRWSPKTEALLRAWLGLQLRKGASQDDQHTLTRALLALRRSHGLRARKLANAAAAGFHSVDPRAGFYPRETRLLAGPVALIHWDRAPGEAAARLCRRANAAADAAADGGRRVLYQGAASEGEPRVVATEAEYRNLSSSHGWAWRAGRPGPVVSDPFGAEPHGWQ